MASASPLCRRPRLLALLLLLAALLGGCALPRRAAAPPTTGRDFAVVTTILPITLFTRAVAGSCASVTALLPANSGPHDFQARPSDLVALRQARVLIRNGLEIEGFLDRLLASAQNPRLVVIDTSRAVATLTGDRPQHGQQHGQHPARAADHHHDHGAVNPHIWLDPLRAVQQVEAIRDGLIQADPGCAAGYRRQAAAYTTQLRQLHREIDAQLRPYRGSSFVAAHDFAPYFAERYGLKADSLVDVPEVNPSPAELQRVAVAVGRSGLRALLSEPRQGNRSLPALAADLGLRVASFDSLETSSEAASRDPATYLMVMRRNVAELRRAVAP